MTSMNPKPVNGWVYVYTYTHVPLNTKYIYHVCVGRQVLNCVCLPLSVFGQAPKKFHYCIFLVWTVPTRLHETAYISQSKCSVQALHHVKNVNDQTGEALNQVETETRQQLCFISLIHLFIPVTHFWITLWLWSECDKHILRPGDENDHKWKQSVSIYWGSKEDHPMCVSHVL